MKLNSEKHKQILLQLLVRFFKERELAPQLAFKGGTCAMLFYELPRFSLDLDFDVRRPLHKEESDTIQMIASQFGKIKDFRDKKYTLFLLLDYQPQAPNIKLEFNKRVWQNNSYKLVQYMGIPISIQDEATLFTNKLVALMDRKSPASRDVFDVFYFLSQGYPLKEELILERTGKSTHQWIKELMPFLKKTFHSKNILNELSYLLQDERQRQWVKTRLLSELTQLLQKAMGKR